MAFDVTVAGAVCLCAFCLSAVGFGEGLGGLEGLGDLFGLAGAGLAGWEAVGATALPWPGVSPAGCCFGWPGWCAGGAWITRWARFWIGPGSAPA